MNLLGIDFEDWFHPELIQKHLNSEKKSPKVIDGIDKILELLRKYDTYATFFVVGELLEHKPELLDKILDHGHEIGFHTMHHDRLDSYNFKNNFESELKKFDKLTSKKSKGFRAPSFSLNHSTSWAIDILEKNGYSYDSSIMPVKTKLYGVPNAELNPYPISSKNIKTRNNSSTFLEFPLLTTKFFGKSFPVAGGFYLRLLPIFLIEKEIKSRNLNNLPATMFIHSWELTPEFMPKIDLPFTDKFITYYNLEKAFSKMEKLLKKFQFTSFERFSSKN